MTTPLLVTLNVKRKKITMYYLQVAQYVKRSTSMLNIENLSLPGEAFVLPAVALHLSCITLADVILQRQEFMVLWYFSLPFYQY